VADYLHLAVRAFRGRHGRAPARYWVNIPRAGIHGLLKLALKRWPPETAPDGGEVLLDGRLGHFGLQRLDIGGDVERLDIDQGHDPGGIEPGEEVRDGPVIGHPGVFVPDGGKEFQEAADRGVAGSTRRLRVFEGVRAPGLGTS
jgi:hypothetical protein